MRRFALPIKPSVPIALALLAVLVLVAPVAAGRSWCARDPIVTLNGAPVQIWLAIPEEYVPAVNGPVEVRVQSPAGVERAVVYTDEGFNGHGEVVRFSDLEGASVNADGSFPVQIQADIPFDRLALRALGAHNGQVPFQIIVVANGALGVNADGAPEMLDGATWVAEGTNYGTRVELVVAPAR